MPTPTTGQISMSQIRSEFGGSGEIKYSQLYRGGGTITGNNISVPTSGQLRLSNFYYNTSTGNGVRAAEVGSTQPYGSSSATSLGYAYYNSIVYYLSSNNWKRLDNNSNFDPCPSNFSPNYSTNKCTIDSVPQVPVNYYLRCWAGGQNTALSCHNGNLYNNRNCGGSYQYCGAGHIRTNYTGGSVTGACWGEMNACRANNGNATWSGSCSNFTVDSCFGDDPNATTEHSFSSL